MSATLVRTMLLLREESALLFAAIDLLLHAAIKGRSEAKGDRRRAYYSVDNTAEIIQSRLRAKHERHRIRFVRNSKNLDADATVQSGLTMTEGQFIVISCGDDVMAPEMVEKMANVWMTENVSLVTTNASYIDECSRSLDRAFRDPNILADETFETLARDGSNACCFGPAIGFERALYDTFGWPPAYLGAYDIMLPFYAYLMKGARFISEPLLKYRVHAENTSLSLVAERSDVIENLVAEERIYFNHLAHAVLMEEELNRLCAEAPERYSTVAERIIPLLNVQLAEMSKKLVRVRRKRIETSGPARPTG